MKQVQASDTKRASAPTVRTTAQITAPLLMIVVLIAMYLSRYLLSNAAETKGLLLDIAVIHLLVLVLPSMVYYLLKKRKLATKMYLTPMKLQHLLVFFASAAVLVLGNLLIKFLYLAFGSATVNTAGFFQQLTDQSSDASLTGILLAAVILPAVCEELLFRGVLLAEYRALGEGNAVLISTICFSMLHFSVQGFPVYLFTGLLLGCITVVCRSVLPAMLLHLLNNLLNVFASDRFLRIILQKNGVFFVGFCLVVLFGLSLFFLLYGVEHLFLRYASKPPEETIPPKSVAYLRRLYLSPTLLALFAVFIIITALT